MHTILYQLFLSPRNSKANWLSSWEGLYSTAEEIFEKDTSDSPFSLASLFGFEWFNFCDLVVQSLDRLGETWSLSLYTSSLKTLLHPFLTNSVFMPHAYLKIATDLFFTFTILEF